MEVFPLIKSSHPARSTEPAKLAKTDDAHAFDRAYRQQPKDSRDGAKQADEQASLDHTKQSGDASSEVTGSPSDSALNTQGELPSASLDEIDDLSDDQATDAPSSITTSIEQRLPAGQIGVVEATGSRAPISADKVVPAQDTAVVEPRVELPLTKRVGPPIAPPAAPETPARQAVVATPLEAVLSRKQAVLLAETEKSAIRKTAISTENVKTATPALATQAPTSTVIDFTASSLPKTGEVSVRAFGTETINSLSEMAGKETPESALKLSTPSAVQTSSTVAPPTNTTPISATDTSSGSAVPTLGEGELTGRISIRRDVAASSAYTPNLSAPTPQSTQLAGSISSQMQVAIRDRSGGKVDIALYPEELGRVRMSISSGDAGMIVTIAAERSETADLMRRHMEQFSRDLQRMGFHDVAFDFQGDRGTGAGFDSFFDQDKDDVDVVHQLETADDSSVAHQMAQHGTVGLDLRL